MLSVDLNLDDLNLDDLIIYSSLKIIYTSAGSITLIRLKNVIKRLDYRMLSHEEF